MDIEFLKEKSILYVEDESELREITSKFLRGIIGNISAVSDGNEALIKFNNEKYDLIVTDINMPRLNGVDLIKEIKRINPSIPIIVTTAYNDQDQLENLNQIGMDEYVNKPVDLLKLVSKMLVHLKKANNH